jgi:iron complex transport system ATP-binding protein
MTKSQGAALAAHSLTVGYRDHVVLHGLNLNIAAGRVTALCGPNGCGKSTLLRTLAGLQPVLSGSVDVNGVPLASHRRRVLARTLTMLAQFNQIPSGLTVRELVAYGRYAHGGWLRGLSRADHAAIDEALATSGLADDAARDVAALSGGERQRAWIAMLVAQDSQCLLLDEPISALDIAHQIEVLDLVRDLSQRRGLGVVVVLHDVNMAARFCDDLIALKGGRLLASGAAPELIEEQMLGAIYGVPMGTVAHPRGGTPISFAY